MKKTELLQTRVSKKQKEKFEAKLEAEGKKVSEKLRDFIVGYIKRKGRPD
jgi:antitoxin component of RelBE/YafQ-DinJ toxin-antitoxin module